jgi:hypothetical protein
MPAVQYRQTRLAAMLPPEVLAALRRLSTEEQTSLAELLRRIGDLIVTFNLPSPRTPIPPRQPGVTAERFIYYVPDPQLAALNGAARLRDLDLHELLRQGALLYMMKKRRQKEGLDTEG